MLMKVASLTTYVTFRFRSFSFLTKLRNSKNDNMQQMNKVSTSPILFIWHDVILVLVCGIISFMIGCVLVWLLKKFNRPHRT